MLDKGSLFYFGGFVIPKKVERDLVYFFTAIKLLAQSIRRSKEIKGITIDEHNEVKLSQNADGTTVLLSDVQSASKLFDL